MDTFLGPFSESLNIPVCDLTQSGLLADRHITVGFLYELRYKWKLKTHQDVVLAILKLKPSYLKVSGKYLKRKLNTCLNRVKLFMDRKDERLDGYLKQKFVLKIPSTQGVCTGSSTDDGLFDDLIDENESSSDAMPPPPHKISEDVCTLNSRGVFQEVDRNVTATKSLNMNVDFDNVDTDHFPATNGNSQLDLSFSASTMGRSNSRNNEALTQYLLGQGTSGSMVTQIEVKQTESKEGCSVGCVADRDQSKDEVDMNDQCDSVDSQKESNILHSPIIRDCEVRLVDTSMRDHELPNETYSSENPSVSIQTVNEGSIFIIHHTPYLTHIGGYTERNIFFRIQWRLRIMDNDNHLTNISESMLPINMYYISLERSSYSTSAHDCCIKLHVEMTEILQVKD